MTYSIANIVATVAGVTATAKIVYDWVQSRNSERAVITGTLNRTEYECQVLRVKIVRLPREDIHVWRISGDGMMFSDGRYGDGGRWIPGDFSDDLELEWKVTSEAGTGVSVLSPSQTFDTRPFYVKGAPPKSGIYSVRLLISKFPNLTRRRWVRFQVAA